MKTRLFSRLAIVLAVLLLIPQPAFADGGCIDLGTLEGHDTSRAEGINNRGHVVGMSSLSGVYESGRAFIWTRQGGMQDLGSLGGYAWATDINDWNQVVGSSRVAPGGASVSHAFLWTPQGGMQDIHALGFSSSLSERSGWDGLTAVLASLKG